MQKPWCKLTTRRQSKLQINIFQVRLAYYGGCVNVAGLKALHDHFMSSASSCWYIFCSPSSSRTGMWPQHWRGRYAPCDAQVLSGKGRTKQITKHGDIWKCYCNILQLLQPILYILTGSWICMLLSTLTLGKEHKPKPTRHNRSMRSSSKPKIHASSPVRCYFPLQYTDTPKLNERVKVHSY